MISKVQTLLQRTVPSLWHAFSLRSMTILQDLASKHVIRTGHRLSLQLRHPDNWAWCSGCSAHRVISMLQMRRARLRSLLLLLADTNP
jgi:hypothetical protein